MAQWHCGGLERLNSQSLSSHGQSLRGQEVQRTEINRVNRFPYGSRGSIPRLGVFSKSTDYNPITTTKYKNKKQN